MSRLRIHSLRPVRPASPVPAARRLGRPLAGMLLIGLASTGLAACSGDGGVSLPSGTPTVSLPSISGIPTPTGTAESPAVPEPTRTAPSGPTRTATPAPTETPTAAPAPTETPTAAPAPTRTATATATQTQTVVSTPTPTVTAPPTETATPSPEPTVVESAEAAAPAEGEEGGISPWWILLVVAVIGAGVTWWVLARSVRRREAQAALVADLESRGRWAIDHGVGELLGAVDAAATQQAWSRLNATLVDMAAGVGTLASEVPADQGAGVIALRDAVAGLQGAAESHARAALTGEPSPSTAEAVFAARDRLAATLDQLEPPPA